MKWTVLLHCHAVIHCQVNELKDVRCYINRKHSSIKWLQYNNFDDDFDNDFDNDFETKSKNHSFNCLSCFYSYLELQCDFIFRNLFLFKFNPFMCIFRFSYEMSKKSVIVGLPIVPYNQNKQSDVCKYLEYVQNFCHDIFKPEEESQSESAQEDPLMKLQRKEKVLEGLNVPLCGDLLGRERVSGAKRARLGCDHRIERFDNIIENVAQWHTKQSFLGVCL